MPKAKSVKNEIGGKAKRLIGEVLGDQELQERQGREERNRPAGIKPFGNLDKLT